MNDRLLHRMERYVELWNEPDREARRRTIEALWRADGANFTQSTASIGYDELEARVASAYDGYVGSGQYRFRSVEPPLEHHNAVRVQWEMVTVADETVASVGLEFLVLDDEGRIVSDHQFLVP